MAMKDVNRETKEWKSLDRREFGRIGGSILRFDGIAYGGWNGVFGDEVSFGEFDLASDTTFDCLTISPAIEGRDRISSRVIRVSIGQAGTPRDSTKTGRIWTNNSCSKEKTRTDENSWNLDTKSFRHISVVPFRDCHHKQENPPFPTLGGKIVYLRTMMHCRRAGHESEGG